MSLHWIDDADHWKCPNCGFETGSPAKHKGCKCPKCGFQDDKDKPESESKRYMELAKSYVQGLRAGLKESKVEE